MSLEQIKSAVDNIGTAFEELKKTNDARLSEIEKKGSADTLLTGKIEKIQSELDKQSELKSRIEKLETSSLAGLDLGEKGSSKEEREYKDAFVSFIKRGDVSNLLEKKALSVASDPDGGFLVTPVMAARITKAVFESSAMRQVANVVSITSDSYDIIADNTQATSGGWTAEQGTVSATATPTIGKKTIAVHEQFAMPKATQKLLDDAGIDVESWLADKIAEILTQTENTAFFTGNGVGQPRGILTYTAGTTWGTVEQISSTSGTAGTLTADDFISLYYSLKEPYQANASYLMARGTVKAARLLKENTTSQYIWAPGLQAKAPDTILGSPVIQCADMGVVTTTDALAVACGDFNKGYTIVDRIGIRTLRDPFTAKPFVQFYTTKRVGGDVENFEAIKLLKMDA